MNIESISLLNFRNHKNLNINFSPKLNFIYGNNAKGKTNILEAIYYFATTKSFRTSKDQLSISTWADTAVVQIVLKKSFGSLDLKMIIDKSHKKTFYLNDEKLNNPSKILGVLHAVLFSPDEMKITKGSPEDRRDFIDNSISELSSTYYTLLLRYEKVLFSKNLLLKKRASLEEIDVFDLQLAELASKIIKQRVAFIDKIAPLANQYMKYLTDEKENLTLKYSSNLETFIAPGAILEKLKNFRFRDLELGYTSIGPHRDDLEIISNDKDLRSFGSQGQQRTAILALKLAVCDVFFQTTGDPPILLLDDVFSELDTKRIQLLFSTTNKYQTIITGTRFRSKLAQFNKIKL